MERSRSSVTSKNGGGDFSFKEFLWQHIETALTKGFDDNVGKHPVTATFEVGFNRSKITKNSCYNAVCSMA
jgi:hypothetical protein